MHGLIPSKLIMSFWAIGSLALPCWIMGCNTNLWDGSFLESVGILEGG